MHSLLQVSVLQSVLKVTEKLHLGIFTVTALFTEEPCRLQGRVLVIASLVALFFLDHVDLRSSVLKLGPE